jgi:hypothetical protein
VFNSIWWLHGIQVTTSNKIAKPPKSPGDSMVAPKFGLTLPGKMPIKVDA